MTSLASRWLLCMILLTFAASARAEGVHEASGEAPPRTMTLAEARAHARAHHARVLAARHRLSAAQRDVDVPGAQWRPRVGGFAQLVGSTVNNSSTTQIGVPTVDIPRIGATPIDATPRFVPYPATMVALGVRQQLYDFGRIAAERTAVSYAVAIERARAAGAVLDTDFLVEEAFYSVLAASSIEEAARTAFERALAHRDLAKANVATGLRPPIELTRAEADVARYEAGMTRARGALHVARSVFAAAAAVDETELGASGDVPEQREMQPLAELLRHAEASPSVREARARVQAQRAETHRLEVQNRPSLYATGSINGRAGGATPSVGAVPPGGGWVPLVPNYDVGVILSWPLVEATWDKQADASRQRERVADADASLALRDRRTAITTAWHDAEVAASALSALERGAEAAIANYRQAEERFRVGLGTSTELADAQALRTEADIQLAIGRFQKARTRVVLARAVAEGG